MEYADLQELWEAASAYQGRIDVAMTYGANNDLQEAKERLEKAMKATDIAGIPAMLCKFDLYESRICQATIDYQIRFNGFLNFIRLHRLDIWKIDRSIGEIEKFMRGVADSLSDSKKALDEKGKTTPSPMDNDAVKLAEAYINGDFPSMTDEAFVKDLLKDCLLISEKKRRVEYLLSQPLDLSGKVRKLMQKAIEEPKPEKGFIDAEDSHVNLDGLKRVWEYCTTDRKDFGKYHKAQTAGKKVAFTTSKIDFLYAVDHADFSKIYEEDGTTKVNVRYLIYYLSQFFATEWYTLAAASIKQSKSSCSGANVEGSFKDKLHEKYKCNQKE